jgi:cellulose synthase operon protein C
VPDGGLTKLLKFSNALLGASDRAETILMEAQRELLEFNALKIHPKIYSEIAQTYLRTVGEEPMERGKSRMLEFFRKMDPKRIANTATTGAYYSLFHLKVVEEVILAICQWVKDK